MQKYMKKYFYDMVFLIFFFWKRNWLQIDSIIEKKNKKKTKQKKNSYCLETHIL